MKEDFLEEVFQLYNDLLFKAPLPLLQACRHEPDKVFISAPEFLNRIVYQALLSRYSLPINYLEAIHIRGVRIIPAYELAITLFHQEYVRSQNSDLIYKILLLPPVEIKTQWYSKQIFSIQQFFHLPAQNFKNN